jgi:hypothetical protein
MTENWEQITSDLYNKINPICGYIYSQVDIGYIGREKLCNIWIKFDMNEFEYLDPFYGLQKSTAPFKMYFNLWDYIEPLNFNNILALEDLQLNCSPHDRIGAFSNSLHLIIPLIKFGLIKKNKIDLYFEYSITNSESYGFMTGSIEDHLTKRGTVHMQVNIKELQIVAKDVQQALFISGRLNKEVYKIEDLKEAKDLDWSSPNYKVYCVSYNTDKALDYF